MPSETPVLPPDADSQNGWPAGSDPDEIGLVLVAVPLPSGRKVTMRVQPLWAPAFASMVQWWDATIEPVTELGSFSARPIRTPDGSFIGWSNHASGTALDINGSKHRQGYYRTLPDDQRSLVREKARSLGLRWGGDWLRVRGTKTYLPADSPAGYYPTTFLDEMHVEVASGPTEDQLRRMLEQVAPALAAYVPGLPEPADTPPDAPTPPPGGGGGGGVGVAAGVGVLALAAYLARKFWR